jgi:hypothetical protein
VNRCPLFSGANRQVAGFALIRVHAGALGGFRGQTLGIGLTSPLPRSDRRRAPVWPIQSATCPHPHSRLGVNERIGVGSDR